MKKILKGEKSYILTINTNFNEAMEKTNKF